MRKLKLREGTNTAVLFGHHDRHLKLIEEDLGVRLSARGEEITLDGNPHTVVGVLPANFELYSESPAHMLLPLTIDPAAWFHKGQVALGIGRLAPCATITTAMAGWTC